MNRLALLTIVCAVLPLGCGTNKAVDKPDGSRAVVRTYDVRDLLNYPSSRSYFEPDAVSASNASPDRIDGQLRRVIEETTSHHRGDGLAIREHDGVYLITAGPDRHDEIARLLDQLRSVRGLQVSVETRFWRVPQRVLDEMGLDLKDDAVVIDDPALNALVKKTNQPPVAHAVTSPRITQLNGQRGYVLTLRKHAYVRALNLTTERAYEPEMGAVDEGLVVEYEPVISADRKHVTMKIQARDTELLKIVETLPVARIAGERVWTQRPITTVADWQAVVSVPDKATLLLKAGTVQRDAEILNAEPMVYLLAVKPQIVVQTAALD